VLSHDGIHTAAYLAGERQVVVLVDEQPLSKREEAAVNRTLDAAQCS